MKTLKLTAVMLLLSAVWSYAQTIHMTMFEKIKDDQVPAAVLQTFESNFGQIKKNIKNGAWYAHFEHTSASKDTPSYSSYDDSNRPMAIPLHYSFLGKMEGKKIEIKFTPQGKLAVTKGLD